MTDGGARLFIGTRISVATANALAMCAETLARRARDAGVDVKWVSPANYHVTLKFLGWTRHEARPAIVDALSSAVHATGLDRVGFRTSRLGAFPALDKASVVWAGVEDGGALAELAQRIQGAMAQLGFPAESRAFHPHVTLGRLREIRPLKEVVLPVSEQMFGDTRCDALVLFESDSLSGTSAGTSVYKEISRIGFKPGSAGVLDAAQRQTTALDLGTSNRATAPTSDVDETDDGWPRGHH